MIGGGISGAAAAASLARRGAIHALAQQGRRYKVVYHSSSLAGQIAALLERIENRARAQGLKTLFVLTTRTAHWFRERGFEPVEVTDLPVAKQKLYNYQRRSKILLKTI